MAAARKARCPVTTRSCDDRHCTRGQCLLQRQERERQATQAAEQEAEARQWARLRADLGLDGSP
jgi:hypothetical protein